MNYKKGYLVTFITAFAIIINLLGRCAAEALKLPVWFDSFGTILVAYIYGPVCGGIVGLMNNVIYGVFVEQQSIYCLVGVMIGIVTGILAKRGAFEAPFKVMTLGVGLAFMCTITSVAINMFCYGGEIGNIWADQIVLMCVNNGIHKAVGCFVAQFYIEFLDKLISSYGVFLLILLVRWGHKAEKKALGKIASILIAVLLASFCMAKPAYAAVVINEDYNSYTHTIYGSYDGLLAGEANDIAQTKEGQLWIGTYAGLYSYDGISFNLYNDIDSIKNVNDLYVDEEGRLWVGTNDDGVTIMINGHVMNVVDKENGLLSNSIKSIICDSNGYYYVGSTAGLSILSLNGGVSVIKSYPEVRNPIRLSADENGNVLAVTDRGELFSFNSGELCDNVPAGISDYTVTSACYSKDGRIYVGTDANKVIIYADGIGKVFYCPGLDNINSFYETEKGEMFICSDSGIGYFNQGGAYKFINTERFNSSIDNMIVDYQGNFWFASSRLGLIKLCKNSFTGVFSEVNEIAHVVNAAAYFNDKLYCGTDDGLRIIDEKLNVNIKNELTELFEGIRIRHISVDKSNNLWIATTGSGLYRIKAGEDSYDIYNFNELNGMPGKRVRCSIELSTGEIAAVGDEGVAFISGDGVVSTLTEKDGLRNIKSLCVIEYKGKVYVGSDGEGISVINNHTLERTISRADGLSSDVILRMVYDEKSDGMFIVTSNGLGYITPEGKIKNLDKFPYSNNYDIIKGEGESLWVLSSAGIYVADSEQLIANKNRDYDLLNSKRGLRASITANSYSYVKDSMLYLCCDNDLMKVSTDAYDLSAKSYRMSLKSVNVDGYDYEISRNEPLYVKADAYNITLEPDILNYSLNDPYISYCLEGVDSEDRVVLLSELKAITYSNLRPGKYTFRIAVLDSSKSKVIESGSYVIIKEMEMYQNWWFKLYIILVAAIILIWFTWFITKSRLQKTVLQQKLELEYAKKQIEMGNETILSIARTVDAKDSNTSEHSFRVSQYSVAIAKRVGFDEKYCENIRQMALLHDIGKIGIPDAILNKPAKLTDEEYEVMKSHVIRGGEILKDFTLIENVNLGAMYHHERYDGKGYCSGLKGEEIPIEARIIGIADAFDAMTANRVYRKQLDLDFVISELKRCRGTQFDPKLTDIMLSLIDEGVIDVETLYKKSKEGK